MEHSNAWTDVKNKCFTLRFSLRNLALSMETCFLETCPRGALVGYPQSPPKVREYSIFVRLSLVFAT